MQCFFKNMQHLLNRPFHFVSLHCSHFIAQLCTLASSWQLAGLVVKILTGLLCSRSRVRSPVETPKFSRPSSAKSHSEETLNWQSLVQCLCLASKRSHTWDKWVTPCRLLLSITFTHNSSLVLNFE